jgi:hypothetical protein
MHLGQLEMKSLYRQQGLFGSKIIILLDSRLQAIPVVIYAFLIPER